MILLTKDKVRLKTLVQKGKLRRRQQQGNPYSTDKQENLVKL